MAIRLAIFGEAKIGVMHSLKRIADYLAAVYRRENEDGYIRTTYHTVMEEKCGGINYSKG